MDKDVKKIITEAFNELYHEMIDEDASQLESGLSPEEKAKADAQVQRAQKYGDRGGFAYDFSGEEKSKSGQRVFNYALDKLIDDYKMTGNPKSKAAIITAFYPSPKSKILGILGSRWQKGDELPDAASTAYETFINKIDGHLDAYNTGTGGFSALVLKNMNSALNDYFQKGYRGKGLGGSQDVFTQAGMSSMDAPEGGGSDERTLGDKMAAGELGVDTSVQSTGNDREDAIELRQKILSSIYAWLKNNVSSEKQVIAFKELTKGNTPNEVYEDNPEMFRDGKDVSRNFNQLMARKEKGEDGEEGLAVDRISELISHAFGINFDMKDIIPKSLRQTISQDTEFSGTGDRAYVASPEVKEANKELSNVVSGLDGDTLSQLGIKDKNDFNSGAKIYKIIEKLMVLGKEEAASDIEGAWDAIKQARNASSEYGKKVQFADKADDEEFGGMFEGYEGFDMEVLMARVMKRISE